MLYPLKKRAYSPENKKTKELSNLMNINSKFTGSGGSKLSFIKILHRSHPKNPSPSPNPQYQEFSKQTSTFLIYSDVWANLRSSENITREEIFQWLSISRELLEK
jgi:hypothetical protein